MIFPPILDSSRNSRKNSSRHLLASFFGNSKKFPFPSRISKTKIEMSRSSSRTIIREKEREKEWNKDNNRMKRKYKKRGRDRERDIKREIEREKKKKKSFGFPTRIPRTNCREQISENKLSGASFPSRILRTTLTFTRSRSRKREREN